MQGRKSEAHVRRLFNHCDWWVMVGDPDKSAVGMSKHDTLEGAKAALLVMLATL